MYSESLMGVAPLKKLKTLEYAVPTKAYEYMACGIPFWDVRGRNKETCRAFRLWNDCREFPDAIADIILYLLNNPEKQIEMGKKAGILLKILQPEADRIRP